MQSLMLECKCFKGRHTAENIAHNYNEVTISYNIDRKIVTTVTDNASNVVKVFRLPGFQNDSLRINGDDEEEEVNKSIRLTCTIALIIFRAGIYRV